MSQGQKFAYFLTALVALPFFVIGLIGLHAINQDLTNYRLIARETAINNLAALDARVVTELKKHAAGLHEEVVTVHDRGLWGIRCIFQKSCQPNEDKRVDLIVSYDEDGNQVYPPLESAAQLYTESRGLKLIASSLSSALQELDEKSEAEKSMGVWSVFQSTSGHHLLTCWQHSGKTTYCAVLNREWLISHVTETLRAATKNTPETDIRLIGAGNELLWQSGQNSISSADRESVEIPAGDSSPLLRRQLSSPLYFWQLAASEPAEGGYKYPLTMLAFSLPLAALFIYFAKGLFQSQRAALAEAEKRANFAASISHELRTPLTNLQLYADLILGKAESLNSPAGDSVRNYTKVIAAETTRLSELVNNALTITSKNSAGHRVKTAAIPDHIITETVNRLTPLLEGRTGKITYRLNATNEVMIDRGALEQIIVNLLDNARKYAKNARIRISSQQEKDRLVLTVRDWGPAFGKADTSRIFKPFSTLEKSEGSGPAGEEGFGLGLAVCKQLVKANNGSITAEHAEPGARFTITLETAPVTDGQQQAAKSSQEQKSNHLTEEAAIHEHPDC